MATYFYIVNQLEEIHVLGIDDTERSKSFGGKLTVSRMDGLDSQLWKWDPKGMLVSKLGLVADISESKHRGEAACVSQDPRDSLSQTWRVEEGSIVSNLNGRVIGTSSDLAVMQQQVVHSDTNDIPRILRGKLWLKNLFGIDHTEEKLKELKSQAEEESISRKQGIKAQRWLFVPHQLWDDYVLMLGNWNPLTECNFWRMVVENHLATVLGYSIAEYDSLVVRALRVIDECAAQLDKVAEGTGIARTTGGAAAIASAGMTVAGLCLAPFTAGLSLGLTVAGITTGVAAGATTITASIIKAKWDKSELAKVTDATAPVFRATLSLQGLLKLFSKKLENASEYLKTPEGKSVALEALEWTKTGGQIAWNAFKLGKVSIDAATYAKQMKEITGLVSFIQADFYALHGANAGVAIGAASPGLQVPFVGKVLVAAGSTSAQILTSAFAVVGLAFGIWDVVAGANSIADGSEMAAEFRKTAESLGKESRKLIGVFNTLQDRSASTSAAP